MKLNKEIFKNILLIFLVMLSIYQTSKLWLEENFSRNFFYNSFIFRNEYYRYDIYREFIVPYRILTNLGDNRFDVLYSDIENSPKRHLIDYVISTALEEGEYLSTHNRIEWNKILSHRSFIYEYSYKMPTDVFTSLFVQESDLLTSRFNQFDMLIIYPSPNASNLINLMFVDTENDKVYEYILTRNILHDAINRSIQDVSRNLEIDSLYYVSSKLMGVDFDSNIFLPKWLGEKYTYNPLVKRSVNFFAIEDSFFDYHLVADNGNVSIYREDNISIMYFHNYNIIEYRDYNVDTNLSSTSLLQDFRVALEFIERDISVKNEIFLYSFYENEDARVFNFNYKVNNFPVLLSSQESINNDLNYAIEVTVENGTVTMYRRFLYVFDINYDLSKNINIDLIEIINSIAGEDINDIRFAYNMSSIYYDDIVNIYWLIDKYYEQITRQSFNGI